MLFFDLTELIIFITIIFMFLKILIFIFICPLFILFMMLQKSF